MTRPGRLRLATAAVLSASVLAACSGGGGEAGERPPVVKYERPGEQPSVAAPTAQDAVLGPEATPSPVASPEKPNLLMITMDDAAMKDMEFMPHLQDVIAGEGVTIAWPDDVTDTLRHLPGVDYMLGERNGRQVQAFKLK